MQLLNITVQLLNIAVQLENNCTATNGKIYTGYAITLETITAANIYIETTVDNVSYRFFIILMYKEIVTTNILIEHTLLDNLFKNALIITFCSVTVQQVICNFPRIIFSIMKI